MRNKIIVVIEVIGLWIIVPILCAFLLLRFDDRLWLAGILAAGATATILVTTGAVLQPRASRAAVHGLAFFVMTAAAYSYLAASTFTEWTAANVLRPFLPYLAVLVVLAYIASWLAEILWRSRSG